MTRDLRSVSARRELVHCGSNAVEMHDPSAHHYHTRPPFGYTAEEWIDAEVFEGEPENAEYTEEIFVDDQPKRSRSNREKRQQPYSKKSSKYPPRSRYSRSNRKITPVIPIQFAIQIMLLLVFVVVLTVLVVFPH